MKQRSFSSFAGLATMLLGSCTLRGPLPSPSLPLTPTPDAPFRQQPPVPTRAQLLRPPQLAFGELRNGLRLIVAEDDAQSTVSIAFAGRSARPATTSADGVIFTQLALTALLEGSRTEEPLAGDGADSGELRTVGEAIRSGTLFSVTGLAEDAELAFGRLAKPLAFPKMDPASFKRAKAIVAAPLLTRGRHVAFQLESEASALLYGGGRPDAGATTDVSGLIERQTLAQMRAFQAAHYVPHGSALVFAGPISLSTATRLAEEKLAAWAGNEPSFPALDLPVARAGSRLLRLAPMADDTDFLVVALPCAPLASPDSPALDVLATLLGRVIRSELGRRLRHDSALSYEWQARCLQIPSYGTFYFGLETDPGNLSSALKVLLTELTRLASQPLSQREIEAASMSYLAHRAARLSSSNGMARELAANFLGGLPDDYFETLEPVVRALTPATLLDVARRYFKDAPLAIVASGPVDTGGELASFGPFARN
jgi:zinc protease